MKLAEVGFAACAGRARSGGRGGSTCAGNGAHGGCVQLLKDGKMMKQQTMPRRLLCAVCAVVLLVSAVPAAWAAEPDADTAAPVLPLEIANFLKKVRLKTLFLFLKEGHDAG